MLGILAAKFGKHLPGAQREVPRERRRFGPGFFEFYRSFGVSIDLQYDVGLCAKKRIDRAFESVFEGLQSKAALFGVVAAGLQQIDIRSSASASGEKCVGGNIHVTIRATKN